MGSFLVYKMATGSSFHSGGSGSRNGPSFASPSSSSSSSSSSGMPGQAQPMAVVWEWQDDLGFWRPYTGQVSSFIEQCLQHQRGASSPSSSSICLAQADPSLSAYIIDIPNLKQFRQDTGEWDLTHSPVTKLLRETYKKHTGGNLPWYVIISC